MRFINSTLHGLLDYAAALALIIAPFVLGLQDQSALAHWASIAAGVGLIAYSLLTNYRYSAVKLIPFKLHLILDLSAAVFFLVAPLIFSFDSISQLYYWVMGLGVLLVVAFTNTQNANH